MQVLQTARLIIRIDTYEDYTGAYATLDDDALKSRFGIRTDEDLAAQKAKVAGGLITHRTSLLFFHPMLKESGEVIGGLAFHNWYPEHERTEIGYDIKAEVHKNKGYMKEALPPVLAYGFGPLALKRIEAFIDPVNTPSRRLVEGAGFQAEGLLKQRYRYGGVPSDAMVYGLLVEDYRARAGNS